MSHLYVGLVSLAERLHRRALELLDVELSRQGVAGVSGVQAMILWHMGQQEMTVSELTLRGCYQGTNVTYNLKRLVESGYVVQERSSRDGRVMQVRASDRGLALLAALERFFADLETRLAQAGADQRALEDQGAALLALERFSVQRLQEMKTGRYPPSAPIPFRKAQDLAA